METTGSNAAAAPVSPPWYIREYRVNGAHLIPPIEVEEAVYPFLGPGRTSEDVEHAAAALQKLYQDKGFQTVDVEIPAQPPSRPVVFLQVNEKPVGRLTVKGSRFYDLDRIKRTVPSMAEGVVPNFNNVTRQTVSLNQWPDRRVTPSLQAGVDPGTVDIDLTVKDTFPLHASAELNNRNTANTSSLRTVYSASYNNLWQLGHGVGFSYSVAPERRLDEEIYSAFYLLRFPAVDWLTLTLQGTKQNSFIITGNLGSLSVAFPGSIYGVRMGITLPPGKNFYQTLTLGWDYKHFDSNNSAFDSPEFAAQGVLPATNFTYYPFSINYNGTWAEKDYTTDFTAGVTFAFRGLGSRDIRLEQQQGAHIDSNFIYLHADLSHEHDLPAGFQVFARTHGQLADQQLLNTEQIAGGGLDSVRGYLEAETLADSGIFGTFELRSPSLLAWWHGAKDNKDETAKNEWRIYAFTDAGYLKVMSALPEQAGHYSLASVGLGSRVNLFDHVHGTLDCGLPLISQSPTLAGDWRFTFRVWADF